MAATLGFEARPDHVDRAHVEEGLEQLGLRGGGHTCVGGG